MEWYAKEFRAGYDNHRIDLTSIDMVSVSQWPSGEWSASGWWKVWHKSGRQPTMTDAFHVLIDTVKVYAEEDKNGGSHDDR